LPYSTTEIKIMKNISRRDFVKVATQSLLVLSGALGLGGLARFLSYRPDPPPPARFQVGKATDYLMDSRTVLPSIPALLVRKKDGFTAYSLVCTHLGCTVQVSADIFKCPCHGSQFDDHGNVTKPPASKSLPTLRVEVASDGQVVVFKNRG
jgi:cytochrome b6-f complex iron-sulfur subunit